MLDSRGLIKNANLTFSSMASNNILTWDRAVLVAALVAELEIYIVKLLISIIHERAFKSSTTYPFTCMIFLLYNDDGVPLWHCDILCTPTGIVDIYLIKDKDNVAAPRQGPRVDL